MCIRDRRVDAVEYRSTVEAQLLNYQNMAMRTLGFAFKIVDDAEASDCVSLVAENDLSFLGVVAISDPIRPDVPLSLIHISIPRLFRPPICGQWSGKWRVPVRYRSFPASA